MLHVLHHTVFYYLHPISSTSLSKPASVGTHRLNRHLFLLLKGQSDVCSLRDRREGGNIADSAVFLNYYSFFYQLIVFFESYLMDMGFG